MLDFRITLDARNPAVHCFRQYRVEAGTDLFGIWVVEITYGRIGTAGRSRSYVLRDEEEAWHLAQSILKCRATAPRASRETLNSRPVCETRIGPPGCPTRWHPVGLIKRPFSGRCRFQHSV